MISDIVITQPGTKVRKRHGRLLLEKDENVYATYPLNHVLSLVCMPGVYVTEPAISYLTGMEATISYIQQNGKLKYISQSIRKGGSVEPRIGQYDIYKNIEKRKRISKRLVMAKIWNANRFLAEKNNGVSFNYESYPRLKTKILNSQKLDELRGIEGANARRYFYNFRSILPANSGFLKRKKRNSRDPINKGLSLLYSLLYEASFSAIATVGLDPFIGFYHDTSYGHASLCSDIMEPFRAQIADRVFLKVIGNKKIREKLIKTENRLDLEVVNALVKGFKRRLNSVQKYNGRNMTNLELIIDDARNLKNYCVDNDINYMPWIRS